MTTGICFPPSINTSKKLNERIEMFKLLCYKSVTYRTDELNQIGKVNGLSV